MNYEIELVNYHNEVIDSIDSLMKKTNSEVTFEELRCLKRFLAAYFELHYLTKIQKEGD